MLATPYFAPSLEPTCAPAEQPGLSLWTTRLARAEIPVLAQTADALEAMRANEDRVDANSIGEMIAGDPLMSLKVLATPRAGAAAACSPIPRPSPRRW